MESPIEAANRAIRSDIKSRILKIKGRLSEIAKSEDFINLKNGNDPEKDRFKNVGGQGLDSLPKAGKKVGKDEGSGGDKKKGPTLGKEEMPAAKKPMKPMTKGSQVMTEFLTQIPKPTPKPPETPPKPPIKKDEMALKEGSCQKCGKGKAMCKCMAKGMMGGGMMGPEPTAGGMMMGENTKKGEETPAKKCAECGEEWPCSDSKRTDIRPVLRAKHVIKQPPKQLEKAAEVPQAKPPGAGGSPKLTASSQIPTPAKPKMPVMSGTKMTATSVSTSMGKSEAQKKFNDLRLSQLKSSGLSRNDLLAGAAFHLNGLNAAILRKDDSSAQKHAVCCTMYERLLGNDPQKGPSKETEAASTKMVKSEVTSFKAFTKDETAEKLFKAILGLLPKTMSLPSHAPAKPLPGVKGPVAGANMRTSGAAGSAPALNIKPAPSIDFSRPGGIPAPQGQASVKFASGPTGANPLMPKPAGSVLANIRQKIFGSKTAASAPPSAESGKDKSDSSTKPSKSK